MRLFHRLQELIKGSAAQEDDVRKPDFHLRIMVATDTPDHNLAEISSEHGPNSLLVDDKLVKIEFIRVTLSNFNLPLDQPLNPHIGLLLIQDGHNLANGNIFIWQMKIEEFYNNPNNHSRNFMAWVMVGWKYKYNTTIRETVTYHPNPANNDSHLFTKGSVDQTFRIAIRYYLNQPFLPADIEAQKKQFYSKRMGVATENLLRVQKKIETEDISLDEINDALASLEHHVQAMKNVGDPGQVISVAYSRKLALFETLLIQWAPSDEAFFIDYLPQYLDCLVTLTCYPNSGQPEDSIDIGSSHFTAFETILKMLEIEENRLTILSAINDRYAQAPLRFPHHTLYGELFWRQILTWLSKENPIKKLSYLQYFPYGSSLYGVFNKITLEIINQCTALREKDPEKACLILSTYFDWFEDYTLEQQQHLRSDPQSHGRLQLSSIKLAYYATLLSKDAIFLVFRYFDGLSNITGDHSKVVLPFFAAHLIAEKKPQERQSDYQTRRAITEYLIQARQSPLTSMLQSTQGRRLTALIQANELHYLYKNAPDFDSLAHAEIVQDLKKNHLLALVQQPTLAVEIKNANIIADLLDLALEFHDTVMSPLIEEGQIARTALSDIVPPLLLDYLEWAVHVVYPTEHKEKMAKPAFSLPALPATEQAAQIDQLAYKTAQFMVLYCPATIVLNHYIRFSKMTIKDYQLALMSDIRNLSHPELGIIKVSSRIDYCVQDRDGMTRWGQLPESVLTEILPEERIKRSHGRVKISNLKDLLPNIEFKNRVITLLTEQGLLFPIPPDPGRQVCDFLYSALMNPQQRGEDDDAYRTRRAVVFFVHSELNYMPDLRWHHLHTLMCAEQEPLPVSVPRISSGFEKAFVQDKEGYLENRAPELYLLARCRVAQLMATFCRTPPDQTQLDSYHRLYPYTIDSYFFINALIKDIIRFFTSDRNSDSQQIATTIEQYYLPFLRTVFKATVEFNQERYAGLPIPDAKWLYSMVQQHLILEMTQDHLLALIHYFGDLKLESPGRSICLTGFIIAKTELLKNLLKNKDLDTLRALLKNYRSHAQPNDHEMTIDWSTGANNMYLLAFQSGADAKFLKLMIDAGCPLGDLTLVQLKAACEGNKTDTYYFLSAHVKFNQSKHQTPASKITLGFDSKKSSEEDIEHSSDMDKDNDKDPYLLRRRYDLPLN